MTDVFYRFMQVGDTFAEAELVKSALH